MNAIPPVSRLTEIQIECVRCWHREPIANPFECKDEFEFGFEKLVCRQHELNYRLWHEEDAARSPDASNDCIADVKRAIDRLNQQRNDMIETLDNAILEILAGRGVKANRSLPINTETPGSAIDRLSIMALRLFHYAEQRDRRDTDEQHRATVDTRIEVCEMQHRDLATSLQNLVDDLFAGRKQHKTYRQLKMYNDPSLNPEIYKSKGESS